MTTHRLAEPIEPAAAAPRQHSALAVPPQRLQYTVRSELTKIVTLRSAWIVPAVSGGFVALIVALSMAFAEKPAEASVAKLLIQMIQIPIIAIAAFITSTITGEYGHETIRVTYAATPRRGRACAGRYLAASVYASVATTAVALIPMAIGIAILWTRGARYWPSTPMVVIIALTLIIGVLTALAGLSLGYLVSHTAAAVTLVAAYIFIEQIIFGIVLGTRWESLAKWLPFSAAWDAALGTESGTGDQGLTTLGRPWGLLYYAALIAILAAVAVGRELRRDA